MSYVETVFWEKKCEKRRVSATCNRRASMSNSISHLVGLQKVATLCNRVCNQGCMSCRVKVSLYLFNIYIYNI